MGPATPGGYVRSRVLIDGQPPAAAHGADRDERGTGTVGGHRLYQIVRQPGPIAGRRFEIELDDAGVQAFAFTFGWPPRTRASWSAPAQFSVQPIDQLSLTRRRLLVKSIALLLVPVMAVACVLAYVVRGSGRAGDAAPATPAAEVDDGKLPAGYRDWRLISVAREEGDLDDIRAVLGNDPAIDAYRQGKTSDYPDGTVIARLAWSLDASAENNRTFGKAQSFVAGHPKNGVQFMVKDAKRYASTGGWKYAQFDDGKPLANAAQLQSCFECHKAVTDRDYVLTRYAQ